MQKNCKKYAKNYAKNYAKIMQKNYAKKLCKEIMHNSYAHVYMRVKCQRSKRGRGSEREYGMAKIKMSQHVMT